MLHRASQLFLPTLRDAPADAEAISHKLLVRGGFIRQVGAGLWTFLPLGWRVHRKVEQIVREEMDAIGAQEWLAPVLTPIELWEQTSRDQIPELFKLEDRAGRRFVLPLTHEETFTFHALELQSYRELPQALVPLPDEGSRRAAPARRAPPRPRVRDEGLLLVRPRRSRPRPELPAPQGRLRADLRALRARDARRPGGVGDDGGQGVVRLSWRRRARARTRSSPARTATTRPTSRSRAASRAPARFPERARRARRRSRRPRRATCEALAELLAIDLAATSKAMPVVRTDGTLVLALLRGDDRLEEAKLAAALGSDFVPATDEQIQAGVRRRGRLARPGRVLRRDRRRRGAARGPVRRRRQPHRAGTCAGFRRAATTRLASPTSASPRKATPAPSAAGASASRRRSRSATSSSSEPAIRSRSVHASSTRTGRSGSR